MGKVAYRVALPPNLSNLHDVFHVSQLRRYVPDPSHVIEMDDIQLRDNLTVETMPLRIEDREIKSLRGKEISLVKVVWIGAAGESATWELESKMRDSYPELFESGNFEDEILLVGESCNTPILLSVVFILLFLKLLIIDEFVKTMWFDWYNC